MYLRRSCKDVIFLRSSAHFAEQSSMFICKPCIFLFPLRIILLSYNLGSYRRNCITVQIMSFSIGTTISVSELISVRINRHMINRKTSTFCMHFSMFQTA